MKRFINHRRLHFLATVLLCVLSSTLLLSCTSESPNRGTWLDATPSERETWTEAISHKNLGLAYLYRSDYESAVAEFETVTRLIPDDPLGFANLAASHLKRQRPEEARTPIDRALQLDDDDPVVRAIQADVYEAEGNTDRALTMLEGVLQDHPDEVVIRYKYLKLMQRVQRTDHRIEDSITQLTEIIRTSPDNLAVLAELGEAQIRAELLPEALATYGTIDTLLILPEDNIQTYLDATRTALTEGNTTESRRNAGILGNLLKVDPTYRNSRDALGDPSQQHPPMYTFKTAPEGLARTRADSLIDMTFTEATDAMIPDRSDYIMEDSRHSNDFLGENDYIRLIDYDMDGRLDISWVRSRGIQLYRNDSDGFSEVSDRALLVDIKEVRGIAYGDIDNDGDPDLYVNRYGRDALYRNEAGTFTEIKNTPFSSALSGTAFDMHFSDLDHDGDLDLLLKNGSNFRFYRNDGTGTFEDITETTGLPSDLARLPVGTTPEQQTAKLIEDERIALDGGVDAQRNSRQQMAIGDFDMDGALDLFLALPVGPNRLYRNVRQGRFVDWTRQSGLQDLPGARIVLPGDFNNDGAPDLLLIRGSVQLLLNQQGQTFDASATPVSLSTNLSLPVIIDGAVFDFDNDGFQDIIVSGSEGRGQQHLVLLRNLGENRFEDVTSLLPQLPTSPILDTGDLDGDGDLDLASIDVAFRILRNDGGNANRWLDVQLVAALRGSGKNNFYGLDSMIELNTETHFQSQPVTSPVTHFGLGTYDQADVMRVVWPNGIPQNRVSPETNTRIVENQRLKGSCPSLYTWDGKKYVFVTHLMTRSAIGALSETGAPAYPDAAADYVKIRGDQLKQKDGKLTMHVVEELWDAVYMDTAQLLVVDHPDTTDIFVNEIYVPPPYPPFELYTATNPHLPVAATDHHGHDILPHLTARDSLYAGDYEQGTYQGRAETHAITLDLGDLSDAEDIRLYLCGWIMPIEPSSNLALSQKKNIKVIPPYLEVPDQNGNWRTVIDYTGFPSGEHKTIAIDLSGKFLTDDYRVRITTNLELYWSEAFFTINEPADIPRTITRLLPESADLHYRGYSREYKISSNGPFLRDYSTFSTEPQWLPFEGYRTRYGDVTQLYQASDNKYAIFSSGEEVTLTFDPSTLPELPEGWTRDYVLHTDGWLKEGDLNTDTAATIGPLPFHGMSDYPYGPGEYYPVDTEIQTYQEVYNTRWVSQKTFRAEIRRFGDGLAKINEK